MLLSESQQTLYRCGLIQEGLFVSFKLPVRDPDWGRNRGVTARDSRHRFFFNEGWLDTDLGSMWTKDPGGLEDRAELIGRERTGSETVRRVGIDRNETSD